MKSSNNSFNLYFAFSSFETKTIIRLARLYGTLSLYIIIYMYKDTHAYIQQISATAIRTKFAPTPPPLPPHMLVFLWTTLQQNFLRYNL